jgi:glutamyl-tRNA synthetase
MGYLPETLRNYLVRLGWSHGDDETISTQQAIDWFDLDGIGRSPARLDLAKLDNLNGHYLNLADDSRLAALMAPGLAEHLGRALSATEEKRLMEALPDLKQRAKTLVELVENSIFYFTAGAPACDEKAAKLLTADAISMLGRLRDNLEGLQAWTAEALEKAVRQIAESEELKLGKVAQPLRAALTGRTVSPGVFDVMRVLGREETLRRLEISPPQQ